MGNSINCSTYFSSPPSSTSTTFYFLSFYILPFSFLFLHLFSQHQILEGFLSSYQRLSFTPLRPSRVSSFPVECLPFPFLVFPHLPFTWVRVINPSLALSPALSSLSHLGPGEWQTRVHPYLLPSTPRLTWFNEWVIFRIEQEEEEKEGKKIHYS